MDKLNDLKIASEELVNKINLNVSVSKYINNLAISEYINKFLAEQYE